MCRGRFAGAGEVCAVPVNRYAEESRRMVCFFGSGSGILWPAALRDAILFKAVYSWRCADEDRHH